MKSLVEKKVFSEKQIASHSTSCFRLKFGYMLFNIVLISILFTNSSYATLYEFNWQGQGDVLPGTSGNWGFAPGSSVNCSARFSFDTTLIPTNNIQYSSVLPGQEPTLSNAYSIRGDFVSSGSILVGGNRMVVPENSGGVISWDRVAPDSYEIYFGFDLVNPDTGQLYHYTTIGNGAHCSGHFTEDMLGSDDPLSILFANLFDIGIPFIDGDNLNIGVGPTEFTIGETAPVPEPSTIFLLGTGLVSIGTFWRRKC
jgi:hypothetical protein